MKGANVLVSEEGCMKLGDFGASKRLSHESVISGLKGTPHWMAPEIIKGQQTSQVRRFSRPIYIAESK